MVDVKKITQMAKIRKTDTKPELIVRRYLFKSGFRYRLYNKNLLGNPDIVLPKYKTVIFVNGCFWHMHEGCKLNRIPKTKPDYWPKKLLGNANRDKINKAELEKLNWKVITVWECCLTTNKIKETLEEVNKEINYLFEKNKL